MRLLLLTAVAVGLFGTITPYLTGRIFDAAIPQSDRGMLVAFGLALAGVAIGTALFKLVQGIAAVRMQARMEASIQSAMWDRLLQLPAASSARYPAGDLADRAAGVDAIQSLIAQRRRLGDARRDQRPVLRRADAHLSPRRSRCVAIVLTLVFVFVERRHQRMRRCGISGSEQAARPHRRTGAQPDLRRVQGPDDAAPSRTPSASGPSRSPQQRRLAFRVGHDAGGVDACSRTTFPILASMVMFLVMLAASRPAAEPSGARRR